MYLRELWGILWESNDGALILCLHIILDWDQSVYATLRSLKYMRTEAMELKM